MDKDDDGEPRRSHGLQWPLHPLQVAAWGLVLFFPIMFGVFTGPFFRPPHSYIWITLYPIAVVATVITNVLAMLSDPVDPASLVKLTPEQLQEDPPADQNPCYYCKAFVHESSKHCRSCNKCILDFDHHCKWLNNCVGTKNYRLFLAFVTATVVTLSMQIGLITYQFVDSFYDSWYLRRARDLYAMDLPLWQGIVGLVAGLAVVADGLLLHLCGFHVWLAIEGLSTYDWILKRREARRKAKAEKKEAAHVVEVEEAPPAEAALEGDAMLKPAPGAVVSPATQIDDGVYHTPVTAVQLDQASQLNLPPWKAEQGVVAGQVHPPHYYTTGTPRLTPEHPTTPCGSRVPSEASPAGHEEDGREILRQWPQLTTADFAASEAPISGGGIDQRSVSIEVY
eukprot:EG_transcript_9547